MARRKQLTPLATAINICDHLSADDIATLVDVLRSRNGAKPVTPKPLVNLAGKKSSTKSEDKKLAAMTATEINNASALASETGATIEACHKALSEANGDVATAIDLLRARKQITEGGSQ